MSCPIRTAVGASLDAAFLLDARGGVLHKNSVARRLFDSESGDAARTHISSFVVFQEPATTEDEAEDEAEKGTRAAHVPLWEEMLRDTASSGGKPPRPLDATAFGTDGSSFSVAVGLAKLENCACSECTGRKSPYMFVVYLHERDDHQQRYIRSLEREVARLRMSESAMDASFDAFFSINTEGTILKVNDAAVRVFGWTREEFVGNNISMITGGGHAVRHDEYLRNYLATGVKKVMGKRRELPARRKDGTEFSIELGLIEIGAGEWVGEDRIFCAFIRDLSHKEETAALTESMINASLDPMFQIDEKGIIQLVNDAAEDVFGWKRHEFLGSNISMIAGGEHRKNHDNYIARYLETGEKRAMGKRRELTATKKNGMRIPIELELTEVKHPDGKRLFCGYVRDLTMQKEKEKLTVGMIESSFDAMFQINEKGIIQLVNNAAVEQFGWTREEFLGRNISVIVGGDHAKQHDRYLMRYLATGVKRVMGKRRELSAKRKDGTEFPIELGLTDVRLKSGGRAFCGFIRDLTQQKLDAQRIQRRQELVACMIDSSFDPMFEINDRGIIQMVNQAAVDHFGWTREEFLGSNISMIAGGEHGKKHDQYLARYLKSGEKRVIGKRRQITARRKDGSEFPIELGVSEVKTVGGEHIFCGFVRDMRREKFDEQELVENEKLTRAITEASPDPMFAIDEHGNIYRVNAAACREFGCQREELLGQNFRTIMSAEYAEKHVASMKVYIEAGLGRNRELEIRSHDGSTAKVTLHLDEVEGPFPILLGLSQREGPRGSRLFAAFVRDLEGSAHRSTGFVDSFLGSLMGETRSPHKQ